MCVEPGSTHSSNKEDLHNVRKRKVTDGKAWEFLSSWHSWLFGMEFKGVRLVVHQRKKSRKGSTFSPPSMRPFVR